MAALNEANCIFQSKKTGNRKGAHHFFYQYIGALTQILKALTVKTTGLCNKNKSSAKNNALEHL